MMLNFICFVAITACGTLIGLEFRRRIAVRIQSLVMFKEIFREMKSMISYNGMSLNEIIFEIRNMHTHNKFIAKCSENISQTSFKIAWKSALNDFKSDLCLNENDVKFLYESAEKLGKSDIDSELDLLELINCQLSDMINEAEIKLKSDGKIYAALGSSCGIITALIII